MSERRDHVSIHIDNILLNLPSLPSKPSIFRVTNDLRYKNEKLYNPEMLSMGPFHRGKDNTQRMEQHKFWYLKLLLRRRKESSVDKYVIAMRSLQEKARKCYAEDIVLNQDDFVQMLLLDGCFIIELIRRYGLDRLRESNDTIFQHGHVFNQLRHDLMLVENQIPLFVLDQLFSMTKSGAPDDDFVRLIHLFAEVFSPSPESQVSQNISLNNIDHFLGLIYQIWCSSFAEMIANKPVRALQDSEVLAINSASELKEAGVKFERSVESNFLDIKFIEGVMKVPRFDVSDETELVLRNLITYEHFLVDNHRKYVTDYAFFLHCLINSPKDVEILRRHGILTNLLGDDEMVCVMFKRLGKNILISLDFCYKDVFDRVNRHSGNRTNKWMANLKHNYFNTPWSIMSFVAAVMLLLFTLTQSVFSVLSYVKM